MFSSRTDRPWQGIPPPEIFHRAAAFRRRGRSGQLLCFRTHQQLHVLHGGDETVLDLLAPQPPHLRLRGVRADASFCLPGLLALWEQLRLPCVVVASLSQPMQKLIKGDLVWQATEVPGTEVAGLEYQSMHWPHPRRLVLIRDEVREPQDTRAARRRSNWRWPVRERAWWRRLWEKIMSPWPNCNAVENRPAFTE